MESRWFRDEKDKWEFDSYSRKQFSVLRVFENAHVLRMHLIECFP